MDSGDPVRKTTHLVETNQSFVSHVLSSFRVRLPVQMGDGGDRILLEGGYGLLLSFRIILALLYLTHMVHK